jgi:hypothetical protein
MIHIISKGYKYIQTQLDDFCGVITETVIGCGIDQLWKVPYISLTIKVSMAI